MQLISWNINGVRAGIRSGMLDWFDAVSPDVFCLQETKARPEQLPEAVLAHNGYFSYWHWPEVKKGYSGVATFTKVKPIRVETGMGIEKFDQEGRVLMTEFQSFILFNVYFPNGKMGSDRLQYKLEFYEAFLNYIKRFKKPVVFCGDVNTAHRPIDLTHPQANEKISGFLPIEREWIDRVIESGYLDSLRAFHPETGLYTWWDLKTRSRERNVGWRIDYFFVDKILKKNLKDATIFSEVMGSDHCPLGIEFNF